MGRGFPSTGCSLKRLVWLMFGIVSKFAKSANNGALTSPNLVIIAGVGG